jgi:hypothetical protein
MPGDDVAARAGGASSLTLAGQDLGEVPESVRGLTTLTALHLHGNRLTGLPDWLGELSRLRVLSAMNKSRLQGSRASLPTVVRASRAASAFGPSARS